jgi:hypothetical protein
MPTYEGANTPPGWACFQANAQILRPGAMEWEKTIALLLAGTALATTSPAFAQEVGTADGGIGARPK